MTTQPSTPTDTAVQRVLSAMRRALHRPPHQDEPITVDTPQEQVLNAIVTAQNERRAATSTEATTAAERDLAAERAYEHVMADLVRRRRPGRGPARTNLRRLRAISHTQVDRISRATTPRFAAACVLISAAFTAALGALLWSAYRDPSAALIPVHTIGSAVDPAAVESARSAIVSAVALAAIMGVPAVVVFTASSGGRGAPTRVVTAAITWTLMVGLVTAGWAVYIQGFVHGLAL